MTKSETPPQELLIRPIGYIQTARKVKFEAPHQPEVRKEESVIELLPGSNYEQALADLSGFERLWLIWWFDRNTTWRPKVLPPRGDGPKRGVFATRSPHRPNPIGITSVPLLSIKGRRIKVGSNDLLDGTPILDIKPYLPEIDSFPQAAQGWVADLNETSRQEPLYTIDLTPHSSEQFNWLKDHNIDLLSRASKVLSVNPSPHRTRRIVSVANNLFRIGCGAWRIFFSIRGDRILIRDVAPGYPLAKLNDAEYTRIPYREEQLAFLEIWESPHDSLSWSDSANF